MEHLEPCFTAQSVQRRPIGLEVSGQVRPQVGPLAAAKDEDDVANVQLSRNPVMVYGIYSRHSHRDAVIQDNGTNGALM